MTKDIITKFFIYITALVIVYCGVYVLINHDQQFIKDFNLSDRIKENIELIASIIIAIGLAIGLAKYSYDTWEKEKENHIRTLPQTWTSFGLLGTFITLTINFYSIELNTDFNVVSLIHKLSMAFITSIIGIIGSQVMNIFINIKYDKKDKKDSITETPEKMLMELRNNTQDQNGVLIDSLRKIEGFLSASSNNLSSLDNNFLNLKKDLIKMFSEAMQNFNTSMQTDISNINGDIRVHVIELQKEFEKIAKDSINEYKKRNIVTENEMRINLEKIVSKQNNEFLKIQNDFKVQMDNFINEVKDGNSKALIQQKEEAEGRSNDIKVISDTIIESGKQTKESLDKIIEGVSNSVSESLNVFNETNVKLLEQQKNELDIRSINISKINTTIINSNEKAEVAINNIVTEMIDRTRKLSFDINKEFNLLINSIKEYASTSENAIGASSSRLIDAASKYDKSVNLQNNLISHSESIIIQLGILIKQREDEFKKYEFFEKELNNASVK